MTGGGAQWGDRLLHSWVNAENDRRQDAGTSTSSRVRGGATCNGQDVEPAREAHGR